MVLISTTIIFSGPLRFSNITWIRLSSGLNDIVVLNENFNVGHLKICHLIIIINERHSNSQWFILSFWQSESCTINFNFLQCPELIDAMEQRSSGYRSRTIASRSVTRYFTDYGSILELQNKYIGLAHGIGIPKIDTRQNTRRGQIKEDLVAC